MRVGRALVDRQVGRVAQDLIQYVVSLAVRGHDHLGAEGGVLVARGCRWRRPRRRSTCSGAARCSTSGGEPLSVRGGQSAGAEHRRHRQLVMVVDQADVHLAQFPRGYTTPRSTRARRRGCCMKRPSRAVRGSWRARSGRRSANRTLCNWRWPTLTIRHHRMCDRADDRTVPRGRQMVSTGRASGRARCACRRRRQPRGGRGHREACAGTP